KINEIRFREIGFILRDKKKSEKISRKLRLKITQYNASEGTEYFLQFVNNQNILFGLLRLRINRDKSAFVRELHVYGSSLEVGNKASEKDTQHKGLGKQLMKKAEEIAKDNGVKELKVISGVGVRQYFSSKLNYHLDEDGIYMIKNL
ncbi:MAG: GNAT family N-acetyltransferase, partial [Nanoarchaeota archaeon]|nr:GNAT family N-acetyltransferase [Nanoarchaeota archaeon]